MSQIDDIREILFIKAKEFKTIDVDLLADINAEIELTIPIVPKRLGDNFNLGVALLTAHNMKLQNIAISGSSGLISSEEIDDHKVTYSNKSISNSTYSTTPYGEQYQALLDSLGLDRFFWGMVV
jgi:hypothetical protein